jgi:uroporphyrinogen III methyltransferase/synthase
MNDDFAKRPMPLFGRRLVVTRPRAQSRQLVEALTAAGADVIVAPMIRIESLAAARGMQEAVASSCETDWLVFTSAAGVDAFFEALALAGRGSGALQAVRVAAVGPATAARLRSHGVSADVVPARYTSEALLDALAGSGAIAGKCVVLPRADIAPRTLAGGLRNAGARVIEASAYRTLFESNLPDGLAAQLAAGAIDLVLFTSASTVRAFTAAAHRDGRGQCLTAVRAASIGPETSKTLREAGISIAVEADESTAAGLARAVIEHLWTTRVTPTCQE